MLVATLKPIDFLVSPSHPLCNTSVEWPSPYVNDLGQSQSTPFPRQAYFAAASGTSFENKCIHQDSGPGGGICIPKQYGISDNKRYGRSWYTPWRCYTPLRRRVHSPTAKAVVLCLRPHRTSLISQDPLNSTKKLKLGQSERHRFDLTGTELSCEVTHSGKNRGTFINCYPRKPPYVFSIVSDMTSYQANNAASIPNSLSYRTENPSLAATVKFFCD